MPRLPVALPLGVLALGGLLAACVPGAPARTVAPADSAAGVVPFRLEGAGGAAVVVPVEVNGRGPYPFVVDTGATLTCVDAALADSLGLPAAPGAVGLGATIGGAGAVRLVRVDSLRVGAARADALTACVVDLGSVQGIGLRADGLLGLNVLRSYRVTFDFAERTLTLAPP